MRRMMGRTRRKQKEMCRESLSATELLWLQNEWIKATEDLVTLETTPLYHAEVSHRARMILPGQCWQQF